MARAGLTTSVCAVLFTLLDMSANGRLTTKNALPTTVAARHAGRAIIVSATIASGLPSVMACAGVALQKPVAAAQRNAMILVFMMVRLSAVTEPLSMKKYRHSPLSGVSAFGSNPWRSTNSAHGAAI